MFADFRPSSFDRMMGRNILAKSVGELAALYHPSLKRFISSSGRTGIGFGIYWDSFAHPDQPKPLL